MTKRQWGRVDSPSGSPWFDSRSNNKLNFAHSLKVIQDSLGFRPWITDFQVFLIPDFFSVELEFRIPRTGLSPKAQDFRSTSKNFSDYHTWGQAMDWIWCLTPYRVNPWEVWEGQHRWRVSIGLTASVKKGYFFTVNRQKCMQIDINCPKISSHFSLAFFSISADHHGLLAPEECMHACSQKTPLLDFTRP